LKKYARAYLLLALISGLIIIADQITKSLVRENIEMWTGVWAPWDWIIPYARIIHVPNTGVAFGMFQGKGIVFTILSSIVALVIIYYYPQVPRSDWSLRLAMGLQLGGAVGNLIDRINIGHVTDFISVGNFAVFNIADASITVGVAVLILGVWIQEKKEKQRKEQVVEGDSSNLLQPEDADVPL
jgi:signal peptidase II